MLAESRRNVQVASAMDNNDNDRPGTPDALSPRQRRLSDGDVRAEPRIGEFDDDLENYEEPDRDTDFSSGYGAEDIAEEEETSHLFQDSESQYDPSQLASNPDTGNADTDEPLQSDTSDEDEKWDEEEYLEQEHTDSGWPLRLVVVAAIALVILGIGAYGVLQERADAQEELQELRATLATSISPDDIRDNREALRELQRSNAELAKLAEVLAQENRMLQEAIAALEASLAATPESQAPKSVKPEPAAAAEVSSATPVARQAPAKTTPPKPAPSAPSGGHWFVNFASYTSKSTAETSAAQLKPAAGKTVVVAVVKDGKTYYRVRVIGLADRDEGNKVARGLEKALGVSRLWVGQD